ncbi:ABC-2 type transport system permease protein [Amphibacillus marinus]|uniref:ABC-2 type transport system permease protein n=1 Tax=Amphibacillus marinus TaxID=872970 RepID=A0A1H8K368_9BACI|nr:ABC transporter permease [Amphibacillus marinus]SEN87499.1 ABC-2 type transport system permease protein [Amphibacillus marinus]
MWNIFKKDLLTISRDRSEVIMLLGMPFILISILGFALGGLIEGETSISQIPVALVIENDQEADLADFEALLLEQGIPSEAIEEIVAGAKGADPAQVFLDLLEDPELEELIGLTTYEQAADAAADLEADEVVAVITIPKQFSYHALASIFLNEEPESVIELAVQDREQIRASVIENLIQTFTDRYNLETSILVANDGEPIEASFAEQDFGQVTTVSRAKPVTAFQYYTIGMAAMFALYVGATVSANAFKEKDTHVFARLIMAGERPLRYLTSKAIAATILTFMQLTILFSLSNLLFGTFSGQSSKYWLGMFIITFTFSFVIGGLATLLTAITLQSSQDTVSGIFSGGVVTILAFLGGSFTPVEQISPFIRALGNWTPNGAIMTAYMQLIQGFELTSIMPLLYRVIVMAVVLIVIALIIFPKRRIA